MILARHLARVYEAVIELLGSVTNAGTRRFPIDHPLVASAIKTTDAAALGVQRSRAPALESLRTALR